MQNPKKVSGGGCERALAEEMGVLSSPSWGRACPEPALSLLPPSIQDSTFKPIFPIRCTVTLCECRRPAAPDSPRSSFRPRVPALQPPGRPGEVPVPPAARSHPTPRAQALCPAALGAALPARSAVSPARARTHPLRAVRRGRGSLRRSNRCGRREGACDSHACPAARPSASRRAGEQRRQRAGPPPAPPEARPPRLRPRGSRAAAVRPPPPHPACAAAPTPRRQPPAREGAASPGVPPPLGPRRWAPAARRLSPVRASLRQSAPVSRRARPAQEPCAFTLPAPRSPGARPQRPERASGLRPRHSAACP